MSNLTKENVFQTIIKMAVPMLADTFAINMNNLTNAWFVSRLATEALAAISFAIPVIMLLSFIIRGIGTGTMTLVAHVLGENNSEKTSMFIIRSIIFSVISAVLITIIGIFFYRFDFYKTGCQRKCFTSCKQLYENMVSWFYYNGPADAFVGYSFGHRTYKGSKLFKGFWNCNKFFFDYTLIFGNFGLPALDIRGAAVATIISQLSGLIGAFIILKYRLKLINPVKFKIMDILKSWMKILKFAIPGALGMIMTPVSSAIITRLVANYGNEAVAACGVAGRIEMFAFMIPMTIGMPLIPFIAQNYGARRMDRIEEARKMTMIFAAIYGVIIAVVFLIFSRPLASVFFRRPGSC